MYNDVIMEKARKEALIAKDNFKKMSPPPVFAMGGGGMGGGTISRSALMKNDENIKKSRYIDFVIDYIAEEAPYLSRNIIPHPIAWHLFNDENTYYLHSIDGEKVECAYTKLDNENIIHTLIIGDKILIDKDKLIKHKKYGLFRHKK